MSCGRSVLTSGVLILGMSGPGSAAEAAPPGYHDFWIDSIFMSNHGWPSCARHELRENKRQWLAQRQAAFFSATNTVPVDALLQDEDCQAVVRLLLDPAIWTWTVLATLRFKSDGLHVRAAYFDLRGISAANHKAITEGKDLEKFVVIEERSFPHETRNYLALALNRIGVARLESVRPDMWSYKESIPILWPRPRESHSKSEQSTEWRVEIKAKGKEAFSNSFTFSSANTLADVRYRNLLACVGRVCEPVARVSKTARASVGPVDMHEYYKKQAGTDDSKTPPGAAEGVTLDSARTAPAAEPPEQAREARATDGLTWLLPAMGVAAGAILGAAGAWLLLPRRPV